MKIIQMLKKILGTRDLPEKKDARKPPKKGNPTEVIYVQKFFPTHPAGKEPQRSTLSGTAVSMNGHQIIILPFRTSGELYGHMTQDLSFKTTLYEYIVRNICKAIDNKWDPVSVFKLKDGEHFGVIHKKDFSNVISVIQNFAISLENYELADRCKAVLQHEAIENVIE